MGNYYSGTLDDVKRVAKNIRVGNESPELNFSFTPTEFEEFQKEVDNVINNRLRPIVLLPLRKVTLPSGAVDFPEPIPAIARQMVAARMGMSAYMDSEPAFAESSKQMYAEAEKDLNELVAGLQRGTTDLQGQRPMARDSFIDPYVAPFGVPPRPRT